MGTTPSRNADMPVSERALSEHLATSDDEEQGDSEQRRRREESDDEASEVEEEEDEEEERRRYYGDLLFGGDRFASDILGGMPRHVGERVISRPPRVHQTRSVVCDVNLAKETLRLLPIVSDTKEEGDSTLTGAPANLYQVRFNFDSNVDCTIRLFFAAQERRDENAHLTGYVSRIKTEVPPQRFSAGLNQEYIQPLSAPLDTSLFQESDLEYTPGNPTIPVIIVIEPLVAEPQQRVTSQTTFSTLLKCSDNTYAIKAVKVKIEYCGATYVVHDIYGLEQSSEAGRECVICMSEARDTIVLPCRHMCLCRGCAEVLRYQTNKCPICRSLFTALLKIEVSKGEESDEECLTRKKKKKRGDKGEENQKEHKKKKKDIEQGKEEATGTVATEEATPTTSEEFSHPREVVITVAN